MPFCEYEKEIMVIQKLYKSFPSLWIVLTKKEWLSCSRALDHHAVVSVGSNGHFLSLRWTWDNKDKLIERKLIQEMSQWQEVDVFG